MTTTTTWQLSVQDRVCRQLTGPAGPEPSDYQSPPQPLAQALTLARLLLGNSTLAQCPGSWRVAIPGGTRTVSLTPAP